tara:strand:+ start:414 stop:689 length:276 start_codon:yes stop_codon:yes gene_type:complete
MGKEWQSKLEIGDLLVDTASKKSGILVQKHRVLSTSGNFVNDRWYWAWRIVWNSPQSYYPWPDSNEGTTSETKILEKIQKGTVKHYANNRK